MTSQRYVTGAARETRTAAAQNPLWGIIRDRSRPLTSHEVIVETIAATTTNTGLTVHAELDRATYPTGVKIPDQEMKDLETKSILTRHDFHGEWTYRAPG